MVLVPTSLPSGNGYHNTPSILTSSRCRVAFRPRALLRGALPSSRARPLQKLLEILPSTNRGVVTEPEIKAQVLSLVDELQQTVAGSTTTSKQLSATWKLLWTTEKVINSEDNTLQNVITFPPQGAFIVDSTIQVAGTQRVNFQFTSSKLKLPSKDLSLPPFGKGWFDNVYLDDTLRIAKDSRGDVLIVSRDGSPRVFQ